MYYTVYCHGGDLTQDFAEIKEVGPLSIKKKIGCCQVT
jgi:hypothetical protein